jgi:uncharacterized membrane protein
MKKAITICLVLAAVGLVMSLAVWSRMPDPMPIHFGPGGQANAYGSRAVGLLMLPMTMTLLPLLMVGIIYLDPRREHVRRSLGALAVIFVGANACLLATHALMIRAVLLNTMFDEQALVAMVGLWFAAIGLVLPKLRSNWCVGVRTPWTLSSERVWHLTHRLAGWTLVIGGLLIMALAWLVHGWMLFALLMSAIGAAAIVPVICSYVWYRQERRDQGPTGCGVP